MKSKKLWAMVLVFALLFPNVALHSSTEESEQPGTAEIAGTNRTIDYWQNVIATGDNDAIYSVETTDTLGTTNESDVSDRRITDTPPENIIYVQVDNFDELSNSYYDFNYDWISEGGYVVNPTATEVPSPETTATITPIPSPTATSTPIPSPTATSTPIPS
ncbi:MAG: hypothetical protein J6Z29_10350, partial [Ruminococcus sp.]|nr:hypothetical protein [Ruminococcus sp.]